MEFIDSPAKARVLRTFVKNRGAWLGIRRVSQLSGVSASVVWRQMPTLLRYGVIVEGRRGTKYRVYRLNGRSRLARMLSALYAAVEETAPARTRVIRYGDLERAKFENFEELVAVMDAFESRRGGGRPKSRDEVLTLAILAREAWRRAEASGKVIAEGGRLRINVD